MPTNNHSHCVADMLKHSWVFDWIKSVAIPLLLPKHALARNQVFLIDQDSNAYEAFDSVRKFVFPNSSHRLCAWHKVAGMMEDKDIKGSLDKKGPIAATQLHTVQQWLFSLTASCETAAEVNDSLKKLYQWLGSSEIQRTGGLGRDNCMKMEKWIENSFKSQLSRLSAENFKGKRTLRGRATGMSESWNFIVKHNPSGVHGRQSIATSFLSMQRVEKQRDLKRQARIEKASFSLSSQDDEEVCQLMWTPCQFEYLDFVKKEFARVAMTLLE